MFASLLLAVVVGQDGDQKEIRIPLEACYASFGSEKLTQCHSAWPEYKAIPACRFGPPNIFLVQGKDIREALRSTAFLCEHNIAMSAPTRAETVAEDAPLWLVADIGRAHLGAWALESITRSGKAIRIRFQRLQPLDVPGVSEYYRVWAPLGQLSHGEYQLELVFRQDGKPDVVRRASLPAEGVR